MNQGESQLREVPEMSLLKLDNDKYTQIDALSVSIDHTLMYSLNGGPVVPPQGLWDNAEIIGKGKIALVEMKHKVAIFEFPNGRHNPSDQD